MSLESSIASLIEASGVQTEQAGTLNQTVVDKIDDIDARVAQKLAETDQFIADSSAHLTRSVIIPYNRSEIFSKSGLGIVADAVDPTQSEWKQVVPAAGQSNWHPMAGAITYIRLKQSLSTAPGLYQSPPYSTDHSTSLMRFVMANAAATPAQVKEQISLQNVTPAAVGEWGILASTSIIAPIFIPNTTPYKVLWVQFFNEVYKGSSAPDPQEITAYGGNSNFIVESIENYPNLTV